VLSPRSSLVPSESVGFPGSLSQLSNIFALPGSASPPACSPAATLENTLQPVSLCLTLQLCFHRLTVRQSQLPLLEHSSAWIHALTNLSISSYTCRSDPCVTLVFPTSPWLLIQRSLSNSSCSLKIYIIFSSKLNPTFESNLCFG